MHITIRRYRMLGSLAYQSMLAIYGMCVYQVFDKVFMIYIYNWICQYCSYLFADIFTSSFQFTILLIIILVVESLTCAAAYLYSEEIGRNMPTSLNRTIIDKYSVDARVSLAVRKLHLRVSPNHKSFIKIVCFSTNVADQKRLWIGDNRNGIWNWIVSRC